MTTYVALFRAINVGGKNRLPMADLKAMFNDAGCTGVCNYIQSGNIIFTAPAKLCRTLPELISAKVFKTFKHRPPVILRSAEQLGSVIKHNPFLKVRAAPETLHVAFLSTTPTPAQIATLDPARSAPDAFAVRGEEIYLQLPNGAGSTKLTNQYFDSKLKTISTARNWRTVLTLFEMMQPS